MKKTNFAFTLFFFSHLAVAYDAPKATTSPTIDGFDNDATWLNVNWAPIDTLILGDQPSENDFQGRYKIVWTSQKLYVLAEITDDILIDTHADPLDSYWEDDTLEIFIDEDKSGGNHQKNYNAMAYHIGLDNQVADIDMSGEPRLFNSHVNSVWRRSSKSPNTITWEVSIDVYPDTLRDHYSESQTAAQPVTLFSGKEMGFMIAYCDSDSSLGREHFINSIDIPAVKGDKNRGYIDASVFDTLKLVE